MPVTASRLGHSSLVLDWSGLGSKKFNQTLDHEELSELAQALKEATESANPGFPKNFDLEDISQLQSIHHLVQKIQLQKNLTDCLLIGIGGSFLGPQFLLSALDSLNSASTMRFHFLENPDPYDWQLMVQRLSPETTLVCSMSKSGGTFETIALTALAIDWLGKDRIKEQLVVITDPEHGDLRALARSEGLSSIRLDPSVGGRFSIFSPVGLFPLQLAGLNAQEFLNGAKAVRDYIEKTPLEKNCLFFLANELIQKYPKHLIHVCLPYSNRLKLLSDWFVQLWAESLGKDSKGFTPIAALGPSAQHSILQLLRDGPDDKVTFFVTLEQNSTPVQIPLILGQLQSKKVASELPSFLLLHNHTLQDLTRVEFQATSKVLRKHNRPQLHLQLDQLDEKNLGSLCAFFCYLATILGLAWKINPFDQPGVEEGKVYIRQSLESNSAQF